MCVGGTGSLLGWWKDKAVKQSFPAVTGLARKWLCVPASSTPSERVFSIAGIIDNPKRSRLEASKLSSQVFVHNNYPSLHDEHGDEIEKKVHDSHEMTSRHAKRKRMHEEETT